MKRTFWKRILWLLGIIFFLMNLVAFFHAYNFTHFTGKDISKTNAERLSGFQKIQTVIFGIDNPRPVNNVRPSRPFTTVMLKSNKEIECWYIKTSNPKGTVILYHGYGGQKASMLDKAEAFLQMGYNTLLVDFMGSGGSEGNQTTIGFKESQQVKTSFTYIKGLGEKNIFLFGTSLGAVAIMKSLSDYKLLPTGIIIECPFGSMYTTTCARFDAMKIPKFPMAGLLVFWGGVQNGFWAFNHKPVVYAREITSPTLLLYGEQDPKVSRQEIFEIFTNLEGKKVLKTYPLAGHENYLLKYRTEWVKDVKQFMAASN